MRIDAETLTLYAVTDRSWLRPGESLSESVEELLKGGVTCVQLREKHMDDELLVKEAMELKSICRRYGVPLIINDRPDIAKRVGADGVHVGLSDMRIERARELLGDSCIIGGSAHNVQEALEAQRAGADYIGCGAVFGSSTKTDATVLSVEELKAICQAVTIPVAAIGGINHENIGRLAGTGISGAAVISSLFRADNKKESAERLIRQIRSLNIKKVLTIAGSDCSGGAGIQADIKTLTACGVYAMSAITALTAQNTTGIYGIMEVSPEFLEKQLDSIFTDIRPDAVKIGMLSSRGMIEAAAGKLRQYGAEHVVLDPVMISTSGTRLMEEEAAGVLQEELFSMAEVITPNIPEAEALTGRTIQGEEDMVWAAEQLYARWGCAVLCKGGHSTGAADDLLYENGKEIWIRGERIQNPNAHGTGCTLSSAVAGNLAKGYGLEQSVRLARQYLTRILSAGLDLGKGAGPMNHACISGL